MEPKFDLKTIKNKKPFKRVTPGGFSFSCEYLAGMEPTYDPGRNSYITVTQADFLKEYYPSGHKIFDHTYYPDIWRESDEPVLDSNGNPTYYDNGQGITEHQVWQELVPRYGFPYQQIISSAHIAHATSNDIQHELSIVDPSEKEEKLFDAMCTEWLQAALERAWYLSYQSREITGDAAFVAQLDSGDNFSWRVFSYKNGDQLYPHYDRFGKLTFFARVTHQYDESDKQTAETIEVWDNEYYYAYRRNLDASRSILETIKDKLGMDNYKLIEMKKHGYDRVPVAYMRDDDGPGWSNSQSAIDCYEMAFSQMAHNNQAYGEAILVLKSQAEMPAGITRGLNGTIKEILLGGENDSAEFLKGQSASDSYMKQLDTLDDSIYRGSNCVKVPADLKAGDTPASAIKLLFANALNQAQADAEECGEFVNEMWSLFAYAYGRKNDCFVDAISLKVHSWVKPFVHLSETEITASIVSLKSAEILSAQTAQERVPFYSKPGEMRRIENERKAKQDAELLYEQTVIEAQSEAQIEQSREAAKNNPPTNNNSGWSNNNK